MINKLNIKQIFLDHFNSLVDYDSGKVSISDIVFFFIVPAIPAFVLVHNNYFITSDKINILISTNSIFIGLLFNVLALLYSFHQASKKQTDFTKKLIKELLSNISFEIILLIFSIIIAMLSIVDILIINCFLSFLTYYFSLTCFFTLFMVLKRIYTFITYDVNS